MPEVLAKHGNIDAVKYKDGAHHLHEIDPIRGFKHLSSDEYLQNWGHDPNVRLSGEHLIGGGVEPTPVPSVETPAVPEMTTDPNQELRQMILEQGRQIQALTEQVQALVALLSAKAEGPTQEMPKTLPEPSTDEKVGTEATEAAEKAVEEKATAEAVALEAAEREAKEREDAIAAAVERVKREAEEKATAELAAVKAAVEEARKVLARFALRRESRAGDYLTPSALIGRSQEDRRGYQEAMDTWKQAVAKYQDLRYDALMIEHESDEAKVSSVLKAELIAENNAFIELKYKLNEERQKELTSTKDKNILGKLNAKKNQFAIWWSKQPTWRKWVTGIGAGAGVGFAVSATAGLGLAALAAGAATRYSLGLINNKGSLINVSTKAKAAELKRVEKHYKSLLNLSTDHLLDQLHGQTAANFAGSRISKDTLRHMNKNRLGRAIMLGGAALTALGLLGIDYIPDRFGWPGHTGGQNHPGNTLTPYGDGGSTDGNTLTPYSPGGSGDNIPSQTTGGDSLPGLSPSELKLDTIYSQDMHGFVMGTKDLLERQGISVQGLTDEKARLMGEYMQNNHWNLIEGMQNSGSGDLEQHVVNASSWSEGINNPSHAQAWTSKDELAKFMQVAHDRFGVEFSR